MKTDFFDNLENALILREQVKTKIISESSKEYRDVKGFIEEAKKQILMGLRVPNRYKIIISYMKEVATENRMKIARRKRIPKEIKFV